VTFNKNTNKIGILLVMSCIIFASLTFFKVYSAATNVVIGDTNVGQGSCKVIEVRVNSYTDCIFPLIGNPDPSGTYSLPPSLAIGNGTDNSGMILWAAFTDSQGITIISDPCFVDRQNLVCNNLSTFDVTSGPKNVSILYHYGGSLWSNKAVLNVTANTAPKCTVSKPCFLNMGQYEFLPNSNTSIFANQDVNLKIKPGKFSQLFPSPGNKYVCQFRIRTENIVGTDFSDFSKNINKLTGGINPVLLKSPGGSQNDTYQIDYQNIDYTDPEFPNSNENKEYGCKVTLPALKQNLPQWRWEITLGEADSNNQLIKNVYQTKVSYYLLYGSSGAVSIV